MPLDIVTLKSAIKDAFLANLESASDEQKAQIDIMADSMSDAMKSFVESSTITYTAGLIAPPGGGAVTGTFTNIIS